MTSTRKKGDGLALVCDARDCRKRFTPREVVVITERLRTLAKRQAWDVGNVVDNYDLCPEHKSRGGGQCGQ